MFLSRETKVKGKPFPVLLEDALQRLNISCTSVGNTATPSYAANLRPKQTTRISQVRKQCGNVRKQAARTSARRKRSKRNNSYHEILSNNYDRSSGTKPAAVVTPLIARYHVEHGKMPENCVTERESRSTAIARGPIHTSVGVSENAAVAPRQLRTFWVEFPDSLQIRSATLQSKYDIQFTGCADNSEEDLDAITIDLVQQCNKPQLYLPDIHES